MKGRMSARDLQEFTSAAAVARVNVAGPKIGERPLVLIPPSGVSFSMRSRITRAA